MRATLQTATGGHVACATMPDYAPAPDVLLWGGRVFVLAPQAKVEEGHTGYREGFAVSLDAARPNTEEADAVVDFTPPPS